MASQRTLPPDGFASVVLPFFSDTWLPDERGLASEVTDFRLHRATRRNTRTPRYFCVRLCWDGAYLHQLCDPNDTDGRTTGVVRAAVEEFWGDLRRAHWIDAATRSLVLTFTLSSNSMGVAARYRLIFEFPSSGYVLTSFDVTPFVMREGMLERTSYLLWAALGLTLVFCVLECVCAASRFVLWAYRLVLCAHIHHPTAARASRLCVP